MTTSRKIFYRNLPQLLLKAREELLCHFRPILNHFGLTEPQWRILRALSEREKLEPREIGEICKIGSPSLAGMLARLADQGMVQRSRFQDDQRRVLVQLTEDSQRLLAEITPLIEEQYRHLEDAYGTKLIKQLYDILDQVMAGEHKPVKRIQLPPKRDGIAIQAGEDE